MKFSGHYIGSLLGVCLLACGMALPAFAKNSDIDEAIPTFYLDVTYGFTTYKSKMVESNDTGTGLTYTIGGHAGVERQFGFKILTDSNTTSFLLNESSVGLVWQDTVLSYRLGYFYIGAVLGQVDIKANNQGTDTVDASGSGFGGNTGFFVPINRMGVFYMDVSSVTLSTFHNALEEEIASATRMDIDLGANFDLTRSLFDLTVGYMQRTMSFGGSETYAEVYYMTYFGLRTALYF